METTAGTNTTKQATKTPAEIADLKHQWIPDGSWDIEDTEGFEAHRSELHIWRLEYENRRLGDTLDQLRAALRVIGEFSGALLPRR